MTMSRRIVVTGMGAVTPLGENFPVVVGRAHRGPRRAGAARAFRHDAAAAATTPPAPRCRRCPVSPPRQSRRLSRASRLAIPAAREALAQAGLLDAAGRSTLA